MRGALLNKSKNHKARPWAGVILQEGLQASSSQHRHHHRGLVNHLQTDGSSTCTKGTNKHPQKVGMAIAASKNERLHFLTQLYTDEAQLHLPHFYRKASLKVTQPQLFSHWFSSSVSSEQPDLTHWRGRLASPKSYPTWNTGFAGQRPREGCNCDTVCSTYT